MSQKKIYVVKISGPNQDIFERWYDTDQIYELEELDEARQSRQDYLDKGWRACIVQRTIIEEVIE